MKPAVGTTHGFRVKREPRIDRTGRAIELARIIVPWVNHVPEGEALLRIIGYFMESQEDFQEGFSPSSAPEAFSRTNRKA
ncbi:hypothetical protein CC2G_002592 [Coprinopsis cinerea AmutBmut pab1-1]|nr:hypothetical protein CC2G_002592 [Coprinopsis cinerea AmutBmut pab1-1]